MIEFLVILDLLLPCGLFVEENPLDAGVKQNPFIHIALDVLKGTPA